MTYPIEKVLFPTVTICPTNMNLDRWGVPVKVFDFLKRRCPTDQNCTDIQVMFHTLSNKVWIKSYEAAKQIVSSEYSACSPDIASGAWNITYDEIEFEACTEELANSNSRLGPLLDIDLKLYTAYNMQTPGIMLPIHIQIGLIT